MSIPVCPTCGIPADTHPAGWCLDAWVHKYIMGGKGEAPEYSTDIAAAFEVWRKAVRRGWCSIVSDSGGVQVKMKGLRVEIAEADVAEEPLAICRAALMAKADDRIGEKNNDPQDNHPEWNTHIRLQANALGQ